MWGDQFYSPPISMDNGVHSQGSEATTTLLQQVDAMIMSGSIRLKGSLGLSIGPDSQRVHNGPPYEATTTPLQQVDRMIMSGSIRKEGGQGFSNGPDGQPVHNGLPHEETTTPLQQLNGMIMSQSIRPEGSARFSIGQGSHPVHNGPPYKATTTPLQQVDGMIMSRSFRREGSPGFSIGPDSQSPRVDSLQKFPGHDVSAIPEYPYADALKLNPNALVDVINPTQRELVADTNVYISKIEPTMAEAEAIARGLQTIKYDDLEEIRELGSGTYGNVFHAKWKGSDVAIKRIKAKCFTEIPSERARLMDVYSFGIVMWELLTGDEPYADMHYASVIASTRNTLRAGY